MNTSPPTANQDLCGGLWGGTFGAPRRPGGVLPNAHTGAAPPVCADLRRLRRFSAPARTAQNDVTRGEGFWGLEFLVLGLEGSL